MADKPLPEDHHVARYCGHQKVLRENGKVVGVLPLAFEIRTEKGEQYLSASWLERAQGNITDQLKGALGALRRRFAEINPTGRGIGPMSGLLRMQVKDILGAGVKRNLKLRVLHEPKHWNPDYAAIRGTPRDNSDAELLNFLSASPSLTFHSANDLDAA